MPVRNPGWVAVFQKYVKAIRIQSKHAEEDPDGKGIPLEMWASQKRVMEEIIDGLKNNIHVFYILKSRQLGVTTITLAILIFWTAWHPNTVCCQVSDSEKQSNKNRLTIRSYLKSLAPFMGKSFVVVKDNKFGFEFSNGSRIDLLVAGKNKVAWGEGEGYLAGLLTEVASYGRVEGLESFRHAMAPENPRALYVFESTAHGANHWADMWHKARQDPFSSRCIFVGWWSHDKQQIRVTDRRFHKFGSEPPDPREWDLINVVKEQYGHEITMEQLAWYRWNETQPSSGAGDMDQNQPWYEGQAFVLSGISFFQTRLVSQRIEEIGSHPGGTVPDGGYDYIGYTFMFEDEYHMSRIERLDPAHSSREAVKLKVWEHPDPEGWYSIGFDPAFGQNERNDNHAIEVNRCFADKLVQVAEYADNIPDTRSAAWVLAYIAGQYRNCRINIDMSGGPGQAVMQAFKDLRDRMASEMYQTELRRMIEREKRDREDRRNGPLTETERVGLGSSAGGMDFEDFLASSSWYLYRRIDAPGPGFAYNSKLGRDLKFAMMNLYRDSWRSNLLEIRSIDLLTEMNSIRQDASDIGAPGAAPGAEGRDRDDRTYAEGLSNETWVKNLRPGLIAQGITWEGAKKKASGELSPIGDMLTRKVYSILRAQAELDDMPPAKSFWDQRGLRDGMI